jgi:putative FmdB family regulatory protein
MPTYEYECKSCSHSFEVFQPMSDPPVKDCPLCGSEVRRLIFGGTGVIFKGSGFYVTDKGKSAAKSEGKVSEKKETSGTSPKPEGASVSSGSSNGDSGSKQNPAGGEVLKSSPEKLKPEPKSA